MERLTQKAEPENFYVTKFIDGKLETETYFGEAVERLAKFENLFDHLMKRKNEIPMELDTLRNEGKTKTYGYKEKFAEKLMNDMMLSMLEQYGLK